MIDSSHTGFHIALTTCADQTEADRIARALIDAQLAACVNILPGARSLYRWQGKVEESSEVVLIIKTSDRHLDSVEKTVAELHSYEIPEFLVLDISAGSASYLAWLANSLQ